MKRVAIYARVSTSEQTTENQKAQLEAVAARHGWTIVGVFCDEGLSGSFGRDKRPAFDDLCAGITRRDFDQVAAWSIDRLGRSLQGLLSLLSDLQSKSIDLYLHQQGLDTATPSGKAMFQMLGVFAEFERGMIADRVRAGLARAKSRGAILGRPRISPSKEDELRSLLEKGVGVQRAAKIAGTGVSAAQRVKKHLNQPN